MGYPKRVLLVEANGNLVIERKNSILKKRNTVLSLIENKFPFQAEWFF